MMKAATKQTIKAVVDEAWQGGALNELKNYVRMPCKSKDFDVDWEANGFLLQVCRNAAAWGRRLFPEAVFEVLTEPGRTPALFFDIPASGKDNEKAVFFYGHFDKQPEGEGWSINRKPFEPTLEGDRLYGRGGRRLQLLRGNGGAFVTSRGRSSSQSCRGTLRDGRRMRFARF